MRKQPCRIYIATVGGTFSDCKPRSYAVQGSCRAEQQDIKGGVMKIILYVVIAVAALGAAVLFSAQNASPVTVTFYNWRFTASLAIVVFLSIIAGAAVTAIAFFSVQLTKSIRRRGGKKTPKHEEKASSSPDIGQGASG
jgi:uncharacterized integral membrane protein